MKPVNEPDNYKKEIMGFWRVRAKELVGSGGQECLLRRGSLH